VAVLALASSMRLSSALEFDLG
jgi:hypothetical protein